MIREQSTKRNEHGLVRHRGKIKLQKQRKRKIFLERQGKHLTENCNRLWQYPLKWTRSILGV